MQCRVAVIGQQNNLVSIIGKFAERKKVGGEAF